MRQIDDHLTIRCELMAMKQKDRGFVVEKRRAVSCLPKKNFVENGVHCCCDTFVRWYPDEIARLAAGQSCSKADASETPRLRLFERAASGVRMVA